MANSDKNILITPNISAATGVYPTIKFNGANNTPINLSVLDDGTISFSSTAGQLFSISDGLTGTIFSVNDISGIPSIEVLDTGLVKINQYGGSTVFGSSAAIQNASSVNAKVSISTVSATTPGLIIKGVSSQSANLQEWQSSDGTVLSNIGPNGTVTLKSIASSNIATFFNGTNGYGAGNINYAGTFNINGANMGFPYTSSGAVLAVNATYAGSLPISVRGYASQTADLQQWQNSAGTVLSKIDYTGALRVDTNTVLNNTQTGGTTAYIKVNYANTIPLIVQGAASQTANLLEFQDSSGTVVGKYNSSYQMTVGSLQATVGDVQARYGIYGGGTGYLGALSIVSWAANVPTAVLRGYASQTANLQEWQNSSGTALARIKANGNTVLIGALTVNQSNTFEVGDNYGIGSFEVKGTSFMIPRAATGIGLIIKGFASQTANLQEWQNNSGTVLAKVESSGTITVNDASINVGGGTIANVRLSVRTGYEGNKGIVVQGYTGQTANLQEWQNSAGSVLAKVDASGYMGSIGVFSVNDAWSLEDAFGGSFAALKKTTSTVTNPGSDKARIYLVAGTTAGTLKLVVRAGASGAETTILDNIPQS